MKKILLIITAALIVCGYVFAQNFFGFETMSHSKVCKLWGENKFSIEKFKKGSEDERAKMACSLLEKKSDFIGKDRFEIKNLLGPHDGFYFSGLYPAYLVHTATKDKESSWQILFMINGEQKIKNIVVHKNCCYK